MAYALTSWAFRSGGPAECSVRRGRRIDIGRSSRTTNPDWSRASSRWRRRMGGRAIGASPGSCVGKGGT